MMYTTLYLQNTMIAFVLLKIFFSGDVYAIWFWEFLFLYVTVIGEGTSDGRLGYNISDRQYKSVWKSTEASKKEATIT